MSQLFDIVPNDLGFAMLLSPPAMTTVRTSHFLQWPSVSNSLLIMETASWLWTMSGSTHLPGPGHGVSSRTQPSIRSIYERTTNLLINHDIHLPLPSRPLKPLPIGLKSPSLNLIRRIPLPPFLQRTPSLPPLLNPPPQHLLIRHPKTDQPPPSSQLLHDLLEPLPISLRIQAAIHHHVLSLPKQALQPLTEDPIRLILVLLVQRAVVVDAVQAVPLVDDGVVGEAREVGEGSRDGVGEGGFAGALRRTEKSAKVVHPMLKWE
jgi:hypothetical protein